MILISHPTGNENVRQAARALNEVGLLSEFWTCVYWNQKHALNSVLPSSVTRELNRRTFPHLHRNQLRCHPWLEVGRLAASRFGISGLVRHELGRFSVDSVYRSLDTRVASRLRQANDVRAVYAYEDAALASFRAAKRLNVHRIYELPIGYWRFYQEMMREEAELQPEWAGTLQGSLDSAEKRQRKDEELSLANEIFVASNFVRRTLLKAEHFSARVTVIPYGAPETNSVRVKTSTPGSKLRVVFVGALTQRKGISYLFRAANELGSRITLTLIGRRYAGCRALDAALRKHRWLPSLSHFQLLQELRQHDVMVFPSLFEGFGLVLLEAMSQGVPVITTQHTAAPDFIADGEDGFIVPIRDVDAIVQKLDLLSRDRERLAAMSQAAIRKADEHSWQKYRERLASTVLQALGNDHNGCSTVFETPQLRFSNPC